MSGVVVRGRRKDLLYFDFWLDGVRYHFNSADFILPRLKPGEKPPKTRRDVERHWSGEVVAAIKRGENPRKPPPAAPGVSDAMTVREFLEKFKREYVEPRGLRSVAAVKSRLKALDAGLGHLPVRVLNRPDDINEFRRTYGRGRSITSVHRTLEVLRTAINWGRFTTPPILISQPFHRFGVSMSKKDELKRERRLSAAEEHLLLQHARPLMHDRIVGALELCCRKGEMSKIQNRHVDLGDCSILIPAAHAKTKENRRVFYEPEGRLAQVLIRRAKLGPLAYVFGTESGRRQPEYQGAWESVRLRGYGFTPEWRTRKSSCGRVVRDLSPDSRAHLAEIDLTFHDLRHEGASRLLRDGVDIRTIQLMLGHSDVKTTQRYLNITDDELRTNLSRHWEQRRQRGGLKAVK